LVLLKLKIFRVTQ